MDVSIAAFMAMSRGEQARFLSDERALAAWFLGVLGGQASADADRLETAAAGMHADLAAAVRTLLAEVERRGRDGVDAVRDHAAGVVTDMSVAMREAVAQIRDLLRDAATRYAVDIDRLYAKVDEQGRDNLAEFVAALDAAKPDTTPIPPVTRWPDDDGPVPSISLRDEIEAIYAENRGRIVRQIEELEERKAALVEEVGTYFRMTRDPSGSEVMHISLVQDEIIEIEAMLPPLQRVLDDNEKVIQFEYGGLATKISVVHGDLWDADSVTVLLPGTGSTIQNFGKTSDSAIELRKAQLKAAPGRKAVVIAALCYEAPTGPDVDAVDMVGDFKSGGFLERAGDDIAEFIRSVPMPDGATLNAVGHSYGSTALGQATVAHGLVWDNVVLAGSPGAVARSADEFGGDVFAAALPGDPITGIGDSVFGDWGFPYGAEFGATILGEYDPPQYYEEYPDGLHPGVTNFDMSQHSNYFVKGSTMLKEIARATVDR